MIWRLLATVYWLRGDHKKRCGRKKGSRNVKDADAIQPRPKGRELRLANDTRGFVADPQQSGLKRASASGRYWA